ncbi:hypothetical protein HYALB_00003949 [Hymenoscyphus albidus]|uniref:F-box domain-containing protein n=1 Tax=Hymenoscyphus albidus TaxID=595503 RepID=A0A9N9Q5D0_9HELO|nr:hypothetical protein HYALB_00003949 [Hymenoscyphus albidus]
MRKSSASMSDSTPSKKRKTRGAFVVRSKTVSWPEKALPVEIFNLIINYLPRSAVQNMRLVNHEFEEKVSEYLFRVVVVPFKPEIYGISGASDPRVTERMGSVMLQDKGMRVFEGFGKRIRKFAMSFEFDEEKLANPPLKSDQEAITSFWGIYRWPYKKYNRYTQLEGLEQTADETRSMAKALRCISEARVFGLSIDGGLGWLAGPDTNYKVLERGEKPVVFGESNFVPEPRKNTPKRAKGARASDSALLVPRNSSLYAAFERMLQEAGYGGDNLEASVRMMLESEDTSSTATPDPHDSPDQVFAPLAHTGLGLRRRRGLRIADPWAMQDNQSPNPLVATNSDGDDDRSEEEAEMDINPFFAYANGTRTKVDNYPLKPNELTSAQREMLLETEWAQCAFMQSYAIAVIDNPLTFSKVTELNIARIPSRHLTILRREDFWDSLPSLNTLSLAVIPDWREVVKLPTSFVQDNLLQPSKSVSGAYQILQDQISHRPNITSLHFEWLCGGEYAPGMFSRNQHILAAPLVPKALDMINRAHVTRVLTLPHVKTLSLKNCWISPHVLNRFGSYLRAANLKSFKFDSVSLTAPVPANTQPVALAQNANQHPHPPVQAHVQGPNVFNQLMPQAHQQNLIANAAHLQGAMAALGPHHGPQQIQQVVQQIQAAVAGQPPANPDPDPAGLEWLNVRPDSWAQIIDALTPGINLSHIQYRNDIGPEPTPRPLTRLTKLEFISCGYARLPLDYDQSVIDPDGTTLPNLSARRASEMAAYMMKTDDHTLAIVVNRMSAMESATLRNAWDMTVGWSASRSQLATEARIDGLAHAGRGRFDGLIEVAESPVDTIPRRQVTLTI